MRNVFVSMFVNVSPVEDVFCNALIVFAVILNYASVVGYAPVVMSWVLAETTGMVITPMYCIFALVLENYFCVLNGVKDSILSIWIVKILLSVSNLNLTTLIVLHVVSSIPRGFNLNKLLVWTSL